MPDGPISAPAAEIAEHGAELPALGQRHRDDGREQKHDRVLKKTMGLHASSVHRIMACTQPFIGAFRARLAVSGRETVPLQHRSVAREGVDHAHRAVFDFALGTQKRCAEVIVAALEARSPRSVP